MRQFCTCTDSVISLKFFVIHFFNRIKMSGGLDWSSRYQTPLNIVFSRQHKLELEWKVELALLKALGESKLVPVEAYDEVKSVIECRYLFTL